VTGEEWDTRWWVIFEDILPAGANDVDRFGAALIADRECGEQFGPRPEEAA
jgi:hypothetical protein